MRAGGPERRWRCVAVHRGMAAGTVIAAASLLAACRGASPPDASTTRPLAEFALEEVTRGVYVARAERVRHGFVEGNVTFILGDDAVLVVDAGFLPSTAERLIAALRTVTDRPVRYLVNTHWHGDHHHGNMAWRRAYPEITFVAHAEGKREIVELGIPDVDGFRTDYYPPRIERVRTRLAEGRDAEGAPLTDSARTALRDRLAALERTLDEIRTIEVVPADTTFQDSLVLDLGGRDVVVRYLGLGNTSGDALVYIPDERVLVTGDLVVHPRPYATSDHYREWASTLERTKEMPVARLVPGHGEVQDDFVYVDALIALFRTVPDLVDAAAAGGASLEAVQERITIPVVEERLRAEYGLEPGLFGMTDGWVEYVVRRAYEQRPNAGSSSN